MAYFVKDYYALGLQPNGYDLLIDLIDLELGLADSPRQLFILGFILEGWTYREIGEMIGLHHSTVQEHVYNARKTIGDRLVSDQ